jgi:hypothetical protein
VIAEAFAEYVERHSGTLECAADVIHYSVCLHGCSGLFEVE